MDTANTAFQVNSGCYVRRFALIFITCMGLTISYKALKVSMTNPAQSLRAE
ncbi:hypothetical protein [Ferruginibacter sp. HRS2-29]|uniref:hypothetical protein n=1 Tax=Ferruginibacter sp. HRS2-29 TaxID=2487334 RepID=UPI0020CCF035|nr:hypothetical protein [Ferruginibacter sp. HRS2-29]